MRQTLWAEQMIYNKDVEDIKADHFLHIHIIPKADTDLLDKKYHPANYLQMEEAWRACLTDQSQYVIVDPKDFLLPVKESYPELWEYLSKRYFNI